MSELVRESLQNLMRAGQERTVTDLEWDALHVSGRLLTDLELACAWILCMRSRNWDDVPERGDTKK